MSHKYEVEHGLADGAKATAGRLISRDLDNRSAILVDSKGRALIGDDQVHGGRQESTYTRWLQGLHDRGVDTAAMRADLETVWTYLRRDPKWELDPHREYGGLVMFGSPDIDGATVLANISRERNLANVPIVFSGYADPARGAILTEAERFGTLARQHGVGPHRILEDRLASNTAENALNSVKILRAHGRNIESIAAVSTPQHARRVWGTIMQHCPGVRHASIVSPDVSVETYLKYGLRSDPARPTPPDQIVSAITGEIKRLDEYPAEGQVVFQEIPGHVRAAYNRLIEIFPPSERRF